MEKKDVAMLLILFLFLGTSLYIAKNLGNNRITGYSVFSGNPAGGMNLTISDETDSAEKYDSEQIRFFANLTNSTDGAVIDNTSANVSIYFPDLGIYDMTFNSTSQLWEFNITFGLNGTFLYNITGNSSLYAPTVVIAQDSFFLLPLIAVNNSGALFSSLVQCLTVNDGALARCTVTRENYKETINGTYIFYNTTIDMDENNITIDCNNSQWIASNQSGWYWVDHPGGNSNLTLTNCIVSNYNVGFATSTFTSENWSVINMTIRNTTLYAMALNGIDGMLIQGMNAEGTIRFDAVTNATLRDSILKNASTNTNISIYLGTSTSNIRIINTSVASTLGGLALDSITGGYALIENSTINDTVNHINLSVKNSVFRSAEGNLLSIVGEDSNRFVNNSVFDCQNSPYYGIKFTNAENLTIGGNIIENCTYGIETASLYSGLKIVNNMISNTNGSIKIDSATSYAQILNNTFKNLMPQTLLVDHFTTNSPRDFNGVLYSSGNQTHYLSFPGGTYQVVGVDDTALDSIFDGTENLSICMLNITSPVANILTAFGRMSEFNFSSNYSDWCAGAGYTCSCDYFRGDFVIANGLTQNYTVLTDTNLSINGNFSSPHRIDYRPGNQSFYAVYFKGTGTLQNNTFFSNQSLPYDVYIENANFTSNNLLSNTVKDISGNTFCIGSIGNFYEQSLTPISEDCGQITASAISDQAGTIDFAWVKQDSGKTVSYDIFINKTVGGIPVKIADGITSSSLSYDAAGYIGNNVKLIIIPWISGSRFNGTWFTTNAFNVNEAPVVRGSSGGGGAGAPVVMKVAQLTVTEEPQSVRLVEGTQMVYSVDIKQYTLKVSDIQGGFAELFIAGSISRFDMNIPTPVDITNDGKYDIAITLKEAAVNRVLNGERVTDALLEFVKYSSPQEAPKVEVVEAKPEKKPAVAEAPAIVTETPVQQQPAKKNFVLAYIIILAAVTLAVAAALHTRKGKKRK